MINSLGEIGIKCSRCEKEVITIYDLPNWYDPKIITNELDKFKGILFCEECKHICKKGFRLVSKIKNK